MPNALLLHIIEHNSHTLLMQSDYAWRWGNQGVLACGSQAGWRVSCPQIRLNRVSVAYTTSDYLVYNHIVCATISISVALASNYCVTIKIHQYQRILCHIWSLNNCVTFLMPCIVYLSNTLRNYIHQYQTSPSWSSALASHRMEVCYVASYLHVSYCIEYIFSNNGILVLVFRNSRCIISFRLYFLSLFRRFGITGVIFTADSKAAAPLVLHLQSTKPCLPEYVMIIRVCVCYHFGWFTCSLPIWCGIKRFIFHRHTSSCNIKHQFLYP